MSDDSANDTRQHARAVGRAIEWFTNSLLVRGWVHDSSKLEEPEKAAFDASGDEGCG
jgi:hypothetical protein